MKSRTLNPQRVRRAAARIRQLACLDVTGPQLAPLVLQELRDVLPFDTGGYFHPGAGGALECYMEEPDVQAIVPAYLDERMQQQVQRVARPYDEAARLEFGPQIKAQLIKVPLPEFERSDFYNVLLRPVGLIDCVSLMPRLADDQPVGALKLYRTTDVQPFVLGELGELARLERFIAMALASGTHPPLDDSWTEGTELLIMTPEGRLLWMSERGESWMAMALGSHWRRRSELPNALALILQRLRWIRTGEPTQQLPQLEIRKAQGLFTIRACLLSSAVGGEEAVGIQITRQVSSSVRLLQALRGLGLPPRQAEIAYWLARGLPEADIASRIALSQHTVVHHRRQLHATLGTRNRKELVARLLNKAKEAVPPS
jgi:DNA-binding CsgD family transcriptional regulator